MLLIPNSDAKLGTATITADDKNTVKNDVKVATIKTIFSSFINYSILLTYFNLAIRPDFLA